MMCLQDLSMGLLPGALLRHPQGKDSGGHVTDGAGSVKHPTHATSMRTAPAHPLHLTELCFDVDSRDGLYLFRSCFGLDSSPPESTASNFLNC